MSKRYQSDGDTDTDTDTDIDIDIDTDADVTEMANPCHKVEKKKIYQTDISRRRHSSLRSNNRSTRQKNEYPLENKIH